MTHYTILPPELVFQETVDPKQPLYKEIFYQGVRCEMEMGEEGTCTVNRIFSTCPADYLRPELQPGSVFTLELNPRE